MARTRKMLVGGFSLLLGVIMLAPALAQPPGGSGRRGGGMPRMMGGAPGADMTRLLGIKKVQEELELMDDQIDQLKALRDESRNKMRGMFQGGRPDREKMQQLRKEMLEGRKKMEVKVKEILLPHQLKRLQQIQLQVEGLAALRNPKVLKKLGITDDQKKKMQEAGAKILEKMRSIARPEGLRDMDRDERQAKMEEFRKQISKFQEEAGEELLKILTSEQKEKWEEMKGEKFEIDPALLRGSRGGNRQGRNAGKRQGRGPKPE